MTKRIALDFEDGPLPGTLVVVVTLPILGVLHTRRVQVSDEDARAMVTKVESLLTSRRVRRLPGG